MLPEKYIHIHNASENNLKSLSVKIPRNRFTVVTGVSGSGKSTLIFDVLYREASNLYLGSFSSGARHFFGKMKRPDVELIESLSPALSVDQKSFRGNPRSTAGTITGIYDYLRLLFARAGHQAGDLKDLHINRNLFSFNSPAGACPVCNGLGVEDYLDPDLLVADEKKSLRDRALVITAPNGYIIYSQVTMEVLDSVCQAEGFSVDIPWKDLTSEQKKVILYGSDKIQVPFGKHTLESRMKWTGITAKPRETGYYKGIIPIMETILKRDRNKNILRFVRTVPCHACDGRRLNGSALSVKIGGYNIHDIASLQFDELSGVLRSIPLSPKQKIIADAVYEKINALTSLLADLGLGYLSCTRESGTLSAGEAQRMRLAVQTSTGLTGITCLFDEPSVGLHPRDTLKLISILKKLRDKGNTVIVIEHEEEFIRHADWLIDIGPGAGAYGGELIYSGPISEIRNLPEETIKKSRTISFLLGKEKIEIQKSISKSDNWLIVEGAAANNLRNIDVRFRIAALNVITGVSGAGKSSLAEEVIGKALRRQIKGSSDIPGKFSSISGSEKLSDVISIDQSPIGRTPRSNPATYTGLSDLLRDLFASLPDSLQRGLTKSHFSFNTEGGRCENCQGAGYIQTGMHFMGNVEIPCEICEGKRFKDEILEVRWNGKNMHDILDMFISEALDFFKDQPKIYSFLKVMDDLGLGYLKPGQRSTTLSGGEAQRIKLATELARPVSKPVLYILDEPTNGLHQADVSLLLSSLSGLTHHGHTVIIIEHHTGIIAAADHVVDLGPGSGKEGGTVVVTGTPSEVAANQNSYTGMALKEYLSGTFDPPGLPEPLSDLSNEIILRGVSTNNLKNIDVRIPKGQMTVITGVSGSGKSSLAFDTIFAEGKNRFMESFSVYIRARTGMEKGAEAAEITGLTPPLAIDQHNRQATARSTVGTVTGIYDFYRLLYARVASDIPVISSLFSFNHHHGACERCDGLGHLTLCDSDQLITDPGKSILSGAMDGTKTGKFYGEPDGQYVATLKAVGKAHDIDYFVSWNELSEKGKYLALSGTGDELYDITWEYRRGERSGEHHFKGRWQGLLDLVNEEYIRKHADHRGEEMLRLMKEVECPACRGQRLNPEALGYQIGEMNISDLSLLPVRKAFAFFSQLEDHLPDPVKLNIAAGLRDEILKKLKIIEELGLPYLQISREISTLSGGEYQRLKLASLLGSGLTGVTFIPDEPTLGLHPSDTTKLISKLRALTDAGNTLVVVEHDRDVILAADHIIEMGPGASANGGYIIAEGTPEEIMKDVNSVTGPYLSKPVKNRKTNRIPGSSPIMIKGAYAHNLKNIDVTIPSEGITAVTGVSGAGKSTLVFDVLYESRIRKRPSGCREITGLEQFTNVMAIRQRASFTSAAATPVTYTGISDRIRDLFANTTDAKEHRLTKNHFSFNRKEGRCPDCEGSGVKKISMDFLPDVSAVCETCNGKRYRDEVLECRYDGKNIHEVLSMTISEMKIFFSGHKSMNHTFDLLEKTGLGYLTGGQSLDTLSGGESRRLVLANGLIRPAKGKTLYLFEEPSSGLHFRDTEYLLILFHELAGHGHALVIVEHDPMVIAHADHVITLGPGGGDEGGEVVPPPGLPL